MKTFLRGTVWAAGILLILAMGTARAEEASAENKKPLSYPQLRTLLTNFADRYMQTIGQGADQLQKLNTDPDARTAIHSLKLFPSSAALSIAIDSNSHAGLLDMVILVHLQGSVWEESLPQRFGKKVAPFLEAELVLQKEIDALAARAMPAEKLEELKTLVEDWRREHHEQRYVSYIRLSDFSDLQARGGRNRGPNFFSIAGLLSTFQLVNMDETTRSVDQARQLGERALYLGQRMPTILRWQSQMLFYEMAATPESKTMIAATQTLRDLPAILANERKAAIEQSAKEVDCMARGLIWEMVKAVLVVILAIFGLALLYRKLKKF